VVLGSLLRHVISSVAGSNFNDCPHRAQSRIVGGSLPKFNLGKLTLKIFNSLQLLVFWH